MDLLIKSLAFRPMKRSSMKDIVTEMERFEKEKKYTINYSQITYKQKGKLLNTSIFENNIKTL
jgi:hypothetical protein